MHEYHDDSKYDYEFEKEKTERLMNFQRGLILRRNLLRIGIFCALLGAALIVLWVKL